MNTLQEFIYHTKAWEYIIAIGYLTVFIVFWKVLNARRPERQKVAAVSWIGLVDRAASRIHLVRRDARQWALGVATVASMVVIVGLAAVRLTETGNVTAQISGGIVIVKPPEVSTPSARELPADHQGRTTCVACHANSIGPALPGTIDHRVFPDSAEFCAKCHGGTGAPAQGNAAPPPTTAAPHLGPIGTQTATTPTESAAGGDEATTQPTTAPATTTAVPGGPKPIPAGHQGRPNCDVCHANGIGGAYPASPDHGGFQDTPATCQACHKGP